MDFFVGLSRWTTRLPDTVADGPPKADGQSLCMRGGAYRMAAAGGRASVVPRYRWVLLRQFLAMRLRPWVVPVGTNTTPAHVALAIPRGNGQKRVETVAQQAKTLTSLHFPTTMNPVSGVNSFGTVEGAAAGFHEGPGRWGNGCARGPGRREGVWQCGTVSLNRFGVCAGVLAAHLRRLAVLSVRGPSGCYGWSPWSRGSCCRRHRFP